MVPLKQIKLHNIASPLVNDDVLTEILLLLPAKSLIRFKSVCKKWLSLISSDYFCRQHTLRHPKLQQSLILQYSGHGPIRQYFYWKPTSINGENVTIPYTLSPSASLHHGCQILQSCNGLWLLGGHHCYVLKRSLYRVYNPTTGQSKKINPTYNDDNEYVKLVALAFDPSESPYYKVVFIISSSEHDGTYRVEVYNSESRSWELGLGPFTLPPGLFESCESLYYDNAIYWWHHRASDYLCFDMAKNEMKPEAFPFPHHHVGIPHSYLQELDGRLYYLRLNVYARVELEHELLVEVWELGKSERWLLRQCDHVFTCDGIHWAKGFICEGIGKCVKLVRFDPDGSLQLIYRDYREMKMMAYSFLRKSFVDLVGFNLPPSDCSDEYVWQKANRVKAFQFGETLALV